MRSRRAALGTLAALGAVAAVAWYATPPAPRAPPARPPQLALEQAQPFSAEPALQLAPRFSPDARFVAFALGDARESRIVVQAVDGSSRQFVGERGALRLSPAFFPDGGRIAFWKAVGADCAIVEYDLRTGFERPLLDCALLPRVRFDLSPDGRSLAFTGEDDARSPAGLWLLDLASGERRRLTRPGAGLGDDLHPRFSPDGRHLAFFRGRGAQREPWLLGVDAPDAARAMARRQGIAHGLAWMGPRGPLLVATEWDGQPGLYVLDPATGRERHAGAPLARFPDVSAAGDVVYEQAREEAPAAARNGLAEAAEAPPRAGTSPAAIDLMLARSKIKRP